MSLFSTIMTVAVVAKSFTAISPVTSVLAQLPEMLLLSPEPPPHQRVLLRTGILWAVACAAYPCSVYNGLALVEATTGAMCSMLASLALPCACYVALYRGEISAYETAAASMLTVVATLAGAAFTTYDILEYFAEEA